MLVTVHGPRSTGAKMKVVFKSFALVCAGSITACSGELAPTVNDLNSSTHIQDVTTSLKEKSQTTHVAILGDSQSTGTYGQRLGELIRFASQQKLNFFGAASSGRIGSWVNGGFSPIPAGAYFGCESNNSAQSCTPSFQSSKKTVSIGTILQKFEKVDLFIITLGDNHFYDPSSARVELPRLIKPILLAGAQCAFVTPTEGLGQFSNKLSLMKNLISALDDVKSSVGKTCTLIDSYTVGKDVLKNNSDLQLMRRAVSSDPMKLHPRGAGAKLWAERVFAALVSRNLLTPL